MILERTEIHESGEQPRARDRAIAIASSSSSSSSLPPSLTCPNPPSLASSRRQAGRLWRGTHDGRRRGAAGRPRHARHHLADREDASAAQEGARALEAAGAATPRHATHACMLKKELELSRLQASEATCGVRILAWRSMARRSMACLCLCLCMCIACVHAGVHVCTPLTHARSVRHAPASAGGDLEAGGG